MTNATNCDKSRQLKEKQISAIPLIISGKSDTQVAETLDVSRQTVNRWRNKEDHFIVELNRCRNELMEAHDDVMSATIIRAWMIIQEDGLGSDNPSVRLKTALRLIANKGKSNTARYPTTVEGVIEEREKREMLETMGWMIREGVFEVNSNER